MTVIDLPALLSVEYSHHTIWVSKPEDDQTPVDMAGMTQITPKGNLRIFPVHEYGSAQITIEVHDRRPDLAGQWDAVDEHLIDLGPPSEPAELVMFTYAAISSWVLYEGHGVVGVRVAGRDRAWNEEEGSHPDPDEEYLLQIWPTGSL